MMNNKELQEKAMMFYKQHKAAVEAVRTNVDLSTMSKASLSSVVNLFEPFDPSGHKYSKGDIFKYNGNIYEVIKDHTTEEHYKPNKGFESLYFEYDTDSAPELELVGEHSPYKIDQKVVASDGKTYKLTEAGWKEV